LVNVNILTEGFDDPKVKTVFLARPTMSTIMMMQMVGRALRGPKANGTPTANIVTFIDDWADKIRWTSPSELMAREEAEFAGTPEAREKAALRLISIRLLEEYATFIDSKLGANVFGDVRFTQRIPVGVYVVSMFDETSGGSKAGEDLAAIDQTAAILVFEHAKSAFDEFLSSVRPEDVPDPATTEFEDFVDRTMREFFADTARLPFSPRRREIRMMADHIAKYGLPPEYFGLEQRDDFDIDKVADDMYERELAAYDPQTGKYRCALTGWQSADRTEFQIDHIKPRSAGGKTVPENLRLLRRRENWIKGEKWEEREAGML